MEEGVGRCVPTIKMLKMKNLGAKMEMGAEVMGDTPGPESDYGLAAPGQIIHEVGTTRMGDDPKTSVTNSWARLHDVDNVFVVDAGPFTSQADKNCTWTIMALAMRTSEYVVDQLKKMNL